MWQWDGVLSVKPELATKLVFVRNSKNVCLAVMTWTLFICMLTHQNGMAPLTVLWNWKFNDVTKAIPAIPNLSWTLHPIYAFCLSFRNFKHQTSGCLAVDFSNHILILCQPDEWKAGGVLRQSSKVSETPRQRNNSMYLQTNNCKLRHTQSPMKERTTRSIDRWHEY